MSTLRFVLSCLASTSLFACNQTDPNELGEGEALYRQAIEDGNSFTCATCHALTEPAPDGLRRPGHPIGDATRRPGWKNGTLDDMRDAVNSCLQEWMNAAPWTAEDPRWSALHEFLDGQTTLAQAPELSFQIVAPPEDLSGGDAEAGRATFNQSCAVCHGSNGAGSNQAPPVYGFAHAPDYTARRVRTSGRADSPTYPELTGGIMPFWAADRLSDTELLDLVAYLEIFDDSNHGDGDGDATGDGDGEPRDCPSTSARVGWTAELQDFFHGVGGTAEIVDDCTVVISNFTYDGTGIDVRIYGGEAGDYNNGYAMTPDLLLPGGYAGTTLVATLPVGQSIDSLDGVSVWCVDVGIDFGSGLFAP